MTHIIPLINQRHSVKESLSPRWGWETSYRGETANTMQCPVRMRMLNDLQPVRTGNKLQLEKGAFQKLAKQAFR